MFSFCEDLAWYLFRGDNTILFDGHAYSLVFSFTLMIISL
jgi:hypothetical protein